MKKIFFIFSVIGFFTLNLQAQMENFPDIIKYPGEGSGNVRGGAGMVWIDEKPYYNIRLTPDIGFKKFGLGLDLNLEFSPEGKLRDENYKTASQILSIIRYVRYGHKNEPIYARIGTVDYYTLGLGNLIYMYNNSISFDDRKTGFNLDLDFDKWGFESMYSDFASGGVAGIRGFVRPLRFSESAAKIPVLNNLEVGLSFAGDFNKKAKVLPVYDNANNMIGTEEKGAMTGFSADLALPVVNNDVVDLKLYSTYTKLNDFGSGFNAGFVLGFKGMGLFSVSTKFERRFNEGKYIAGYFGSMYEVERFGKAMSLDNMGESDNGWFGALRADVADYATIYGSYQRLDKTPHSGILQLKTDLSPKDGQYVLTAGYEKAGIQSESEIFTADDRSHAYVEVGYKPYQYLTVSLVYHWTFLPVRDANDNVVGYTPQKRIEPRITFSMPFSFGN
ncbi:MAG: hypothetical protein F9K26_03865 [Ignavibacteriaceae bacterium]|nr:MAG: hypothetical protein F9K26_03865 [Ignavibacteriaceae bacterium]MBV6445042.1 hypothetical protein [Ignavibacteriaceae bacterium]MBW7872572.1 hypothetical protein [Ignavibacteria bacterium]OQY72814.1 MAG: hypothetical protein B6D45_08745 [Ignavibacteriales bacterium UTCHB3]WKZ73856.1 MAG: hypothetical protein QY308_06500 [Ignavibacteriaceae bacterium]